MTHDDPRLTAYALNELDASDRSAVEAFIASDEQARQFVEETRRTAAMLSAGLALGDGASSLPALTAEQRLAIAAAATAAPVSIAAVSVAPVNGAAASVAADNGAADSGSAAEPIKLGYRPAQGKKRSAWAKWALAAATFGIVSGVVATRLVMRASVPSANVAIAPPPLALPGQLQSPTTAITSESDKVIATYLATQSELAKTADSGVYSLDPRKSLDLRYTPSSDTDTFNISGGAGPSHASRFSNFSGDSSPTADREGLADRKDFPALVAHYRARGAEGIHALDSGALGYSKEQFEQGAGLGQAPQPFWFWRTNSDSSAPAITNGTAGIVLAGANTYTGGTTINGGALSLDHGPATKEISIIAGADVILLGGSQSPNNLTFGGTVNSGGTVLSTTGGIAGTGGLTVNGGTLDLNGVNAQTINGLGSGYVAQGLTKSGAGTLTILGATSGNLAWSGDAIHLTEGIKGDSTIALVVDPSKTTSIVDGTKVDGEKPLPLTTVSVLKFPTEEAQNQRRTVAKLIERSQEQIRQRDYKGALAVLDQVEKLDPNNDYAKGAKPLVYDNYELQAKAVTRDRWNREFTNHMNAAEEKKVPYEDTLRYPENWPDFSGNPVGKPNPEPAATPRGRADTQQQATAEVLEKRRVVAKLIERSQEQIRLHNYKEALGVLDQVLQLDPHNDYARGARPLVYDKFQVEQPAVAKTLDVAAIQADRQKLAWTEQYTKDLSDARDAVALGDRERASEALGRARQVVDAQLAPVFPAEAGEARAQIAQVQTSLLNNESYARLNDNPFKAVSGDRAEPLSTFSIDVDTASYSNIRRFITSNQLPPPDAVRIEELLNYFPYNYDKPAHDSKEPFKAAVEVAACPWNTSHRLARVAIKGREIAHDKRPVSNLVFLIDVSGSMNEPKKLPLVKEGLALMVNELTENDRVSIVVYAGNAGLVLPSTCADPLGKKAILAAIDNMSAGGSTNGGQGIELAYKMASDNFIKGGTNRVLLATDGDWNVGITDQSSLTNLIEEKAKTGVFLSVLGYGFGNLKDSTMEKLADKGNGHYAYIDSLKEAKKVLVEEMSSTLVTIAKDVKIQIEFNPAQVESYRLIGYEKRLLRKEDFNNDKVDAGEIGAGHCVTALYEIVPMAGKATATTPAGGATPAKTDADVDPLKYQKHEIVASEDLMTLKLRYKQPEADKSAKLECPVKDSNLSYAKASEDFKFAAAVAQYGMILRNSPHKGTATLDGVLELADEGKGKDEKGYRKEFLDLVKQTKALVKGN